MTINRIRIGDEGQYSCVLADKEDVQTRVSRNISLDVGVGATLKWVQGYHIQYGEVERVDIDCQGEGGHPPPNLVIRSNRNIPPEVNIKFPFLFLPFVSFRNYLWSLM